MKTLMLLRHGKAVGTETGPDHERALTERGRAQARQIGGLLVRLGLEPDVIIASDASRARDTATIAAGDDTARLTLNPRLYDAPASRILSIVQDLAHSVTCVLVVGHNPGMGEAARALAGSGEPQAMIDLQGSFPTGALAVLEFGSSDWSQLEFGSAALTRFIIPDAN